jgi:hypothetical protein
MFSRHLLEMIISMMLGMCVLGMAFRQIHLAVFGTGFDNAWHDHTELAVFAMTFNMTLPMVAWMRHRGHSWRVNGEMAGAMSVLAPRATHPVLGRSRLRRCSAAVGDGSDDSNDFCRNGISVR